jgi:hypothetical protein
MQSPVPSEYFENIKFNYSFYTTGDTKVTLEYVNNIFLKCIGYAYSRAISTSFNGIIYALGGIDTTNINASGTITANLFNGSGAGLSNLNASNISGGTLGVNIGGTGQNVLPFNQIFVGNGTDPVITSANLTFSNNILSAPKFSGSGAELTNLNASYMTDGTLAVTRGGTGANNFTAGRLLLGNGIDPITNSGNLTWITASNTLSITGDINITGSYKINNNAIVSSQWVTSGTTIEYNGGSVGIGVSPFAYKLNVAGTINSSGLITSAGLTSSALITTAGLTSSAIITANAGLTIPSGQRLTSSGTSILTGNVGIGTTNNLNNILQVGEGGRLRISNGTTDYTSIGTIDIDGPNNTQIIL